MYLQCLLRDALEIAETGRMLDGEQLERIRSALRAQPSSLYDVQRRATAFGYVCIPEAEHLRLLRAEKAYHPPYGTGGNLG